MNFKSLAQQNDTVSNSFYCKGHKIKKYLKIKEKITLHLFQNKLRQRN